MFLSSLSAACVHIILPSKRTKCCPRQPNFQSSPGKHTPGLSTGSRLRGRLVRLLFGSKKNLPAGLNSQSGVKSTLGRFGERYWSYTFKGADGWRYRLAHFVYMSFPWKALSIASHGSDMASLTFSIVLPSILILGSFSNNDGDGRHKGLQKKYFYFTFKCRSCLNLFSRSVGLKTCSG